MSHHGFVLCSSTVAGFLVLVEVDCQMFSGSLELPTSVMSINRRSVFGKHVYVVKIGITARWSNFRGLWTKYEVDTTDIHSNQ